MKKILFIITVILCIIPMGMIDMGNKRWAPDKTDHELETDGFLQVVKSGDNYVYALKGVGNNLQIFTHTSVADIVSEGAIRVFIGDLQFINTPCAMRLIGSRIHIVFIRDTVSPTLRYGFSDDDGVNWTFDEAVIGEDGYDDVTNTQEILDVYFIDGTPYATVTLAALGYRIYNLTDFSEEVVRASSNPGVGYIEDDIYFYPVQTIIDININSWDGTSRVVVETIDLITVISIEQWNSILFKKGSTKYYFGRYTSVTNNVYYIQKGNMGDWNSVDVGEKLIMHLTWEEDRAEPRFIHWGGTIDELYYMNDAGYLLKIARDVTETTNSGIGDFLFPYEITPVDFDIFDVVLSHKHLQARKIRFGYNGTDLQENDGFVITEDDGTVIIIAIESLDTPITGVKQQRINAVEPSFRDLRATIQEKFEQADEKDILTVLFDTYFGFMLARTIDDTADLRDVNYNIRAAIGTLLDIESWNARIYYWDVFGSANFDEGDEVAILITRDYKTGIIGVDKWGETVGAVPDGWVDTSADSNTGLIIAELDDHLFPIELSVLSASEVFLTKSFTAMTSGIIDAWIRTTDVSKRSRVFFIQGEGAEAIIIYFDSSKIRVLNPGFIDVLDPAVNDTWYHLSVEFETGAGGFKGLAADTYNIYVRDINGNIIGSLSDQPFRNVRNQIDGIELRAGDGATTGWKTYVDSIGWSADSYIQNSNLKIVLTDVNSQILNVFKRGQDVNDIIVKGGIDPDDPHVCFGRATVPGVSNQSLVTVIYHYPSLDTDALCIARAAELLAAGVSSLKVYRIEAYQKFIPQVGQTIDVSNTLHSLTNSILIVDSWRYDKDDKIIRIMASTGLLVKRLGRGNIVDANTDRIDKNAALLEALQALGTIYYLDSAASGIGGYKKMLLTYTNAVVENITVSSAVDGEAIEEFATEAGEPGTTNLIAGLYSIHLHASKTGGVQNIAIYFELWKRVLAGGETLLGTSHKTDNFEGADNLLETHLNLADTPILITDRLVVKFKARVSGFGNAPSFQIHIQGDTTSRFRMSFTL